MLCLVRRGTVLDVHGDLAVVEILEGTSGMRLDSARVAFAKVTEVRDRCPELEHLVTFDGSGPDAISLSELRRRGRGVRESDLDRIASEVRPEDVATIVYTSGTTGPPKGCITTHANLMRTAQMYERQIDLGPGSVIFMFLPLAHSLARVTLATNQEMMDLLKRLDPMRIVDQESGTVEIEVPIPAIGLAPTLRKLLRIAASNDVAVPHADRG